MKRLFTFLVVAACLQSQAQLPTNDSAVNAMLIEAKQYLTGTGKVKDETKAFGLFMQCAQQGSANAMNALGILYKEGIGTKPNRKTAIEWFTKSGNAGYAQGWYNLGLVYKDAEGSNQNFTEAYNSFTKAAALADEQSIYALGYMHYKGLGCTQDYEKAATLFKSGAALNKPNSMYFLGLCFRNGYGVATNADSAKYWLTKAAEKGYKMALNELRSNTAENSNSKAKALAQQIKEAQTPNANNLNKYTKVEHNINASAIEGTYKGYIIKYDWSGQNAINSSNLTLELIYKNDSLTGSWVEDNAAPVSFKAVLTPNAMVFKNTQYTRTDHYSPNKPIAYNFKDAKLQWNKQGDTVYLAGNIQMFSPDRKEPQKPQYIVLTRSKNSSNNTANIQLIDDNLLVQNNLKAYPNPFTNYITIDFELKEKCEVETQILTLTGKMVYSNKAGILGIGNYTLPIKPQQLAAGSYIVKLLYGKQVKMAKVVKL